jgi:AraC family transcriptional activator of pobA
VFFEEDANMIIEKEIVEMSVPGFPIKTYIVDSNDRSLSSELHVHDENELVCVLNGQMTFYINGKSYVVNKNQIIMLNSLTPHSTIDTGKQEVTKFCLLQFKPELIYNPTVVSEYKYLSPFVSHTSNNFNIFDINRDEKTKELSNLLFDITKEFDEKDVAYEISIKSSIYKIITLLYRCKILDYKSTLKLYNDNEALEKLKSILNYVETNYYENITVEKACSLLNYSYHYFCKLFKKATGKSFIQYLNFVRINVVEKLLLTTDIPISEIISQTGFSSFSYFNRAFKKIKGCAPSVYRANHIENSEQLQNDILDK